MSNIDELSTRIVDLESKLAFQDDTIEKLNAVVTQQQKQIDQLYASVAKLGEWVKNLQQPNVASINEETPPPHY